MPISKITFRGEIYRWNCFGKFNIENIKGSNNNNIENILNTLIYITKLSNRN